MSRVRVAARQALQLTLLAMLAAALAACGDQAVKLKSTDITSAEIGGEFSLPDHTGKVRALSDFKDKVVVVFFGFVNRPDVCPTTLSGLATAMKELGPKANDVQVLLVTVDPERDTPEILAKYIPAFDPSFLALRGSPAELERTAKLFKLFSQDTTPGGGYTMGHTAGSFVFDKQGRIRLLVPYGAGPGVFAHDVPGFSPTIVFLLDVPGVSLSAPRLGALDALLGQRVRAEVLQDAAFARRAPVGPLQATHHVGEDLRRVTVALEVRERVLVGLLLELPRVA
jgi:protein SCO1/2